MKVAVTTACCFPSEQPIWRLRKSAQRFDICLRPYGMRPDQSYKGWLHIKVDEALAAYRQFQNEGFTHVLYTDGRDSFFLSGMDEIMAKYVIAGQPPCLMSAETACYPYSDFSDRFPNPGHRFRFPCAGQYIAEIEWLLDKLPMLRNDYNWAEDNDQARYILAYADDRLSGFRLDTECELFQSMAGLTSGVEINIRHGRLENRITGSAPSILHFNGGYVDPENGRDGIMKPWWDKLGGWPV